jgi:LysM repeat protein
VSWLRRSTSRRQFLAGSAAIPAAFAFSSRSATARDVAPVSVTPARAPAPAVAAGVPTHNAWVWQFRHDGDREGIRDVLAAHGLGIAIKTNDGTDWMSKYDPTDAAIDGPDTVASLAAFFEDGGVPFHAWSVVKGVDPVAEATIASQVLESGARSMFLDLEAHSGFWRGTADDANRLGEELRRLQPSAFIGTTVDARPWEVPRIPMTEFAQFTDAVAPQVYWAMFNNAENIRKYKAAGDDPGEGGMTARFALQSAVRQLTPFGLPIQPIGDGTVAGGDEWTEFIDEAFANQAAPLAVWRYGVADTALWELLRDNPLRPPTYAVQSGDTLSALAAQWGTTVNDIAVANNLTDVNYLYIGQELVVPGGLAAPAVATPSEGTSNNAPSATASGTEYTIQSGDSLWSLARRFGTTVDAIAEANGISNPAYVRIGDTIIIP